MARKTGTAARHVLSRKHGGVAKLPRLPLFYNPIFRTRYFMTASLKEI